MKRVEQWITLVLLVVSAAYAYSALTIKAKLDDAIGPRAFPLLVSGVMAVLCLVNLVSLARRTDDGGTAGLGWSEVVMTGLGVIYCLLMPVIGYVFSTALFMVGGIRVMGERRWPHTVVVAALASLVAYGLFARILGVTLPTSPLGIL